MTQKLPPTATPAALLAAHALEIAPVARVVA